MAYDVVVAGLGGMGSAAAAHLAARGQRVLGPERFGPAHAMGSSHGGSASDRVAVACGFSGHGFKFVPVMGEILADLTLDGTTRHPIGLFDPGRFSSAAPTGR